MACGIYAKHSLLAAGGGGKAMRAPSIMGPPSSETPLTHGGAAGGTLMSPIAVDALPSSPLSYTEVSALPRGCFKITHIFHISTQEKHRNCPPCSPHIKRHMTFLC